MKKKDERERGKYKILRKVPPIIRLPDNDCAGVNEDYERLSITKIGSTKQYMEFLTRHPLERKKLLEDASDALGKALRHRGYLKAQVTLQLRFAHFPGI